MTTQLVARILAESRLAITEIPGRNGKAVTAVTVWRWIQRGLLGRNGQRVKLEAVKVGSSWVTSREALERFSAALTPPQEPDQKLSPRTPTKRQKASEAAEAELIRRGC